MIESNKYDNYPLWIVILSNLVSISIYALGFIVIFQLGWVIAVFYMIFIMVLEYRLIKKHCINCYYWGKICGFGKGMLSSWFFKKGDISKFCEKKITWKDMIPDILITAIPLIIGILLLIIKFEINLLIALIFIIALTTVGNGFIRSTLTCKFCKQKELGCPADKLFNKE